jgi:hypothetical protein
MMLFVTAASGIDDELRRTVTILQHSFAPRENFSGLIWLPMRRRPENSVAIRPIAEGLGNGWRFFTSFVGA